jgi:hypothetical protein
MRAKVTLTPDLLKLLLAGKPLRFKLAKAATEVEIAIEEDIFDRFDRIFNKLLDKAFSKFEKMTE